MRNRYKHISMSLLLFYSFFQAMAQQDTIYIYEDVVVYDTIVVYDTVFVKPVSNRIEAMKPKPIGILQIDSLQLKANLLLISNGQTATIPINGIILNENFSKNIKNLERMKKLSFFGVVFFAFQSMILAQTRYELSLGSGIWWENGNIEYLEKPYSPLLNVGFFAKRNSIGKNLGIKIGVEYNYLFSTEEYTFGGTTGIWHSKNGQEFESINNNYGAGMHNILIPLLVYYDKHTIQPYVGVNYNFLATRQQTSPTGTKYYSSSHNLGLNLGASIKINQSFAMNMEFKHNLTPDYKECISGEGNSNAASAHGNTFSLKNTQIKISLVYSFKKHQKL